MNKQKKSIYVNLSIITIILIIGIYYIFIRQVEQPPEEIAQCIGENSILYTLPTCGHCRDQKELFGEYSKNLTVVDCKSEPEKCSDIRNVPTWRINNKLYVGVQSIDYLKKLTGC